MANVKISELTALTPPAAADLVPVTDSSASQTKRTTVGEIVGIINGDVDVADDGAATISELPVSKLQDGAARQLLQTDAAGTGVEWTDDVDIPGTLDVTGIATLDGALNATGLASLDGGIDVDGAFTVADATGNVSTSGTLGVTGQSTLASAAVSDLTSGRVVLAGTSGELEDNAGLTFNGTQLDVDGDVIITGDLTVEGTTTTIESQTLTVKDKNIELGVVASPTDTTADGGGITLKGATDKTINWVDSTDAWTLSEHVNIASAKEYRIDGTKVLDATSLGSAVVGSSLTSVGTIGTGVWNGTAIATAYIADSAITSAKIADDAIVNADINASAAIVDTKLDTISTAGKVSNSATTATNANTASAIVARDASGDFTAGTITAALTGNADTATALETARDIGGVSFDGTANINLPGVNTAGNQDTSGNADTATALSSARTFAVTGDLTGTVSSDLTSGASIATSIASGVIVNDDINASAAIAGTKIDPDFGSQDIATTGSAEFGGPIGVGGANYGTAGQVLVSNGSSAAPTWEQITPSAVFGWDHDDDTYGLYLPGTSIKVSDLTGAVDIDVQSRMRRCVINDAGVVQYYLDADDSDMKAGDWLRIIETEALDTAYTGTISESTNSSLRVGVPAWAAGTFTLGQRVTNGGYLWECLAATSTATPAAGAVASDLTGADGQVVVEVPAFSVRYGFLNGVHTREVKLGCNDGLIAQGFRPHPAFIKTDGTYKSAFYFGAYHTYDDAGTGSSVSGQTNTLNQTRAVFRSEAAARGTGWHVLSYLELAAIQTLIVCEFQDYNSQKSIGNGSNAGTTYGVTTGQSDGDGNHSVNSTGNGAVADDYMSYRGIENLYGRAWQFVDGINVYERVVYLTNNQTAFADNTADGYDFYAQVPTGSASYQKELHPLADVFLPSVVTGASSTTYLGDAFWTSSGWRVAIVGGISSNGAQDGAFYLYLTVDSGNSYSSIGSRLCYANN